MSEAAEMIQRAKEIRHRLLFPPNAIEDAGIDLKRKLIPPKTPPTPPIEKLPEVLEYHIAYCKVTITTLKHEHKTLKINPILRAVSAYYCITIPEIKSIGRRNSVVRPRHVAFYIASRYTGLSIAAIGRRFGRDHTTILHAVRKMEELVLVDKDLASTIEMLENRLLAGCYDDPPNNYRPPLAPESEPDMAQPGQPCLPES